MDDQPLLPCCSTCRRAEQVELLKAILERLENNAANTEKVVKATERMKKTLLEATCKIGKLRAIQQTQAAEANPSLPVLDPLEKMEAGLASSEVALEKFIESRAHFATTEKLFEEIVSGLGSKDCLVQYSLIGGGKHNKKSFIAWCPTILQAFLKVGSKISMDEKSVKDKISDVFYRAQNTQQKKMTRKKGQESQSLLSR